MAENKPQIPHLTERAQAQADERRAREAAALRENLRRRKSQARARTDEPAPASQADDAQTH